MTVKVAPFTQASLNPALQKAIQIVEEEHKHKSRRAIEQIRKERFGVHVIGPDFIRYKCGKAEVLSADTETNLASNDALAKFILGKSATEGGYLELFHKRQPGEISWSPYIQLPTAFKFHDYLGQRIRAVPQPLCDRGAVIPVSLRGVTVDQLRTFHLSLNGKTSREKQAQMLSEVRKVDL